MHVFVFLAAFQPLYDFDARTPDVFKAHDRPVSMCYTIVLQQEPWWFGTPAFPAGNVAIRGNRNGILRMQIEKPSLTNRLHALRRLLATPTDVRIIPYRNTSPLTSHEDLCPVCYLLQED